MLSILLTTYTLTVFMDNYDLINFSLTVVPLRY